VDRARHHQMGSGGGWKRRSLFNPTSISEEQVEGGRRVIVSVGATANARLQLTQTQHKIELALLRLWLCQAVCPVAQRHEMQVADGWLSVRW
jgi:hypothetical protein